MTNVVTAVFHQKRLVGKPRTALQLNVSERTGHSENRLVIHVGATVPEETIVREEGLPVAFPLTVNSLLLRYLGVR